MTILNFFKSILHRRKKMQRVSPNELQAKALFEKLQQAIGQENSNTNLELSGRGTQCSVALSHATRLLKIHCFDDHGYLVIFQENDIVCGAGRARVEKDVIQAGVAWSSGSSWAEIYKQNQFVESSQKLQISIRDSLIGYCPEISTTEIKVESRAQDFCDLSFSAKDRAVKVILWGMEHEQQVSFLWHGSKMFELQNYDHAKLAPVIGSWLYEQDIPSVMNQKFPWLETGKLAQYYEQGRELEGEFVVSWDGVEAYYSKESRAKYSGSLLKLIAELRSRGFDKSFRAGQQMTSFIVSRAKKHGLRPEQPNIVLFGSERGVYVDINIDGSHRVFLLDGEFTPEIEQWFRRLETQPVD